MNWPFATEPKVVMEALADRGLHIVGIVLLAAIVRAVVNHGVRAAMERLARASDDDARAARLRTLGGLMASFIGYAIFFMALMMVLDEAGVDTKAIITAAGVFGVAIGLGAQKLVRDVIGGFFILMENQFSVGEAVTLGGPGVTGVVEEMGLRVTRLRDGQGRLVIVGNADIASVTNHSRGPVRVTVDLVVAEETKLEDVRHSVEIAVAHLASDDWAELPVVQGLVEPPEGKVKVRITGQAVAGKGGDAEMALRTALHEGAR